MGLPTGASPTPSSLVAAPSCVVRPEQTEGPYFVDEILNRSDIRSDPSGGAVREGTPLQLAIRVAQISGAGCVPVVGATVDVWHCDAMGQYSDVSDRQFSTVGQKFLRGYQITGENGMVQFTTLYPGWHLGRTVHIHFKVRSAAGGGPGYEFTSQLYFDDELTDEVFTRPPYAGRGPRGVRNEGDRIFTNGGDQLLLQLTPDEGGYTGVFEIGVQTG